MGGKAFYKKKKKKVSEQLGQEREPLKGTFSPRIKMKASPFFSVRPALRKVELPSLHFITEKPLWLLSRASSSQEECCHELHPPHTALLRIVLCSGN